MAVCIVLDMIEQCKMCTRTIKMLILDEADELLSQGLVSMATSAAPPNLFLACFSEFQDQILDIFRYLPSTKQVHTCVCVLS